MPFQGVIESETSFLGFKIVELLHFEENGDQFYAFVAIDPECYGLYRMLETGRVPEWAEELYRGHGRNPPLDVIHQVKCDYGIRREINDIVVRRAMAHMSSVFSAGRNGFTSAAT